MAPILYASYALLTPPFQNFDENQHFFRAWQISALQFVAERRGSESGGELPTSLGVATLHQIGSLQPQGPRSIVRRPISKMFSISTSVEGDQKPIYYDFVGAAVYPPIVYIPQAAAIQVAKSTGLSVEWAVRVGRLINAAICIALIFGALRLTPFGRSIMMIIALLPPTVAAAASFGQDGLMIGSAFLLIGAGLKVAAQQQWTRRDIAVIAVAGIGVTVSKIVYFPLIALAAFPKPRQTSWFPWSIAPIMVSAAAALLLFAWMHLNAHAMVPTLRPWVPPAAEQVRWAVSNTGDFLLLLGRTYLVWLPLSWARLYQFGDSTVPTIWPAAISGTAAVFLAMINGDNRATHLSKKRRVWMLMLFAMVMVLITTAMFIALAPRGAITIEGIQARYFIPVLPLLVIALMRRGETAPPIVMVSALSLVVVAHAATLGTIISTFYTL